MELFMDYLGCQAAMCPACEWLQVCPLHREVETLRADLAAAESDLQCANAMLEEDKARIKRLRKLLGTTVVL